MYSVQQFLNKWEIPYKDNNWIFRGQNKTHSTITASIFRDLRTLVTNFPQYNEEVMSNWLEAFNKRATTLCSNLKLAREFVKLIARWNRLELIGHGHMFHDFTRAFFPEIHSAARGSSIDLGISHISAISQHHGLPSKELDVTFDPAVAAWFAVHRYNHELGRYQIISESDSNPPIVYCFNLKRVKDVLENRFHDLRSLPLSVLRTHRQSGGIFESKYMEDFTHLKPIEICLHVPKTEESFYSPMQEKYISEDFLFPNATDPLVEYFQHYTHYVSDLGLLMAEILRKRKGPLYEHYRKNRKQVIWGFAQTYGTYWIDPDRLLYNSDQQKRQQVQDENYLIYKHVENLYAYAKTSAEFSCSQACKVLSKKYDIFKRIFEYSQIDINNEAQTDTFLEHYEKIRTDQMIKSAIFKLDGCVLDEFEQFILRNSNDIQPRFEYDEEWKDVDYFAKNVIFSKDMDENVLINWQFWRDDRRLNIKFPGGQQLRFTVNI